MIYRLLLIWTSLFNGVDVLEPYFSIYRLENSCLDEDIPIKLRNVSIKAENNAFLVRFDIEVTADSSEETILEFSFTRCTNRAAPDTCEQYHTLKFPRFCALLKVPGPWQPYIRTIEPPFPCPPKKGFYIMPQSIVCNLKYTEMFGLGAGYFFQVDIKQIGMKSNKILYCVKAEGQIGRQ